MVWNVEKCTAVLPTATTTLVKINETPLQHSGAATYLGVTITPTGIRDKCNQERTLKPITLIKKLRRELSIPLNARKIIATTVIYPSILYGLHLSPITTQHQRIADQLDAEVLSWVLGVSKPKGNQDLPRMRTILHVPSLRTRCEHILAMRIEKLRRRTRYMTTGKAISVLTRIRMQQATELLSRLRRTRHTNPAQYERI